MTPTPHIATPLSRPDPGLPPVRRRERRSSWRCSASSSPPRRLWRTPGFLVDSSPLQPPQTATTVRVRNGEAQLSDGPFAEIKEQLGGYYILDCEDLDTALRYVAAIPSAKYGSVEVRPLMVMGPH